MLALRPPHTLAVSARPTRLVRSLAVTRQLWEHRIHRDSTGRWHELLHRDQRTEVWLIGWPAGQGIELHDHGGVAGAFMVVEGELLEHRTDLGHRRPLAARRLVPGDIARVRATTVHDVVNPSPRPALSLHAYQPAIGSMRYYDHQPGSFLDLLREEPYAPDFESPHHAEHLRDLSVSA